MEQHPRSLSELETREVTLEPKLFGREDAFRDFCQGFALRLNKNTDDGNHEATEAAREELRVQSRGPSQRADVALRFACSVVIDLVAQGWNLKLGDNKVRVTKPALDGETREAAKCRVRA